MYTVFSSGDRTRAALVWAMNWLGVGTVPISLSDTPVHTYFCRVLLVEITLNPLNFLHCTEQERSSLYGFIPPLALR